MKSIGSAKLKGLIGLVRLIKSNQVDKKLFRHCLSSIYIEGARKNLSKATTEFFLLCIGKRTKKSRGGLCTNRDSSLKNKLAMLIDSTEGQNLSRWFSPSNLFVF